MRDKTGVQYLHIKNGIVRNYHDGLIRYRCQMRMNGSIFQVKSPRGNVCSIKISVMLESDKDSIRGAIFLAVNGVKEIDMTQTEMKKILSLSQKYPI